MSAPVPPKKFAIFGGIPRYDIKRLGITAMITRNSAPAKVRRVIT